MSKVKRSYDSSRRQELARQSRHRIIESARDRFLRDGYTATTIADIASDAGVSPQTIGKQFGNKPGIVRALFDVALTGDEEGGSLEDRDAISAIHREDDPHRKLERFGAALAAMLPRTAPIQVLLRESGDPQLAAVWAGVKAGRLAGMENLARNLADGGHLREGLDVASARDILWMLSSPELYLLMVGEREWMPERYGELLAEQAAALLLRRA